MTSSVIKPWVRPPPLYTKALLADTGGFWELLGLAVPGVARSMVAEPQGELKALACSNEPGTKQRGETLAGPLLAREGR